MDKAQFPKDGSMFYVRAIIGPFRWREYKSEAKKQMKADGRWQVAGDYGGWDNCEEPNGEFVSFEEGGGQHG